MRTFLRWALALVAVYALLIGVGRVSQLPWGPAYLAAGAMLLAIGGAVAWLATGGQRGRRSSRNPRDVGIAHAAGADPTGPGVGHD